jgi:adenine/guanine phosphoribosyltransferase-like PRPP-binding protein
MAKFASVLFVLSQDQNVVEGIKSSNLVKYFKNTIFIEKELYESEVINSVKQCVGRGGHIINEMKIKNFITNMQTKDILKDLSPRNTFVLSIQNYIDVIKDKEEIGDYVNVQLYHNNLCVFSSGNPANFPEKYIDELKRNSKAFSGKIGDQEVLIGYDNSLGDVISQEEKCESNKWMEKFNEFTNVQQISNVTNTLDLSYLIKMSINSYKSNTYQVKMPNVMELLSNQTYKSIINDKILAKLISIKDLKADVVVALEPNANTFGVIVAEILKVPLVTIKKYDTDNSIGETHSLLYKCNDSICELNVQKNAILPDSDILIIDDLFRNGEDLMGAHDLVQNFSPSSVHFFTIMEVPELKEKSQEVMGDLYKNVNVLF